MADTTEQASFSENETQAIAPTNSTDYQLQMAEVEDSNVWEAYERWRNPHE